MTPWLLPVSLSASSPCSHDTVPSHLSSSLAQTECRMTASSETFVRWSAFNSRVMGLAPASSSPSVGSYHSFPSAVRPLRSTAMTPASAAPFRSSLVPAFRKKWGDARVSQYAHALRTYTPWRRLFEVTSGSTSAGERALRR